MATKGNFKDIYQEVTDAVIEQMEKGKLVWRCGWSDSGLPSNVTTGICYRGWNVFWLNFHTMINGFQTTQYLTFKQALDLGGNIKRGEKGVKIVYWASIGLTNEINHNETNQDEVQEARKKLVPKVYTVFNIAQSEGIEFPNKAVTECDTVDPIRACEKIIHEMPEPPSIDRKGIYPVYYPLRDEVAMPEIFCFESAQEYYSAIFHELGHSTGHARRLARKEITEPASYGSEPYSREELTAEMTSAFLCAITGIGKQTIENSAAYLQGWLSALKNDKTLLIKAAGQAQKAADYILSANHDTISVA
jgi:antirestriction protein ArdC